MKAGTCPLYVQYREKITTEMKCVREREREREWSSIWPPTLIQDKHLLVWSCGLAYNWWACSLKWGKHINCTPEVELGLELNQWITWAGLDWKWI